MLQTVSALLSKQEELNDALEQIKEYNWMVSSWDVCSMFGHMQNYNLKVIAHCPHLGLVSEVQKKK
jgi:hypothetical protein